MAQKAATIYVIDVAPSMQLKQEGGEKTYLQCSTEAVASMLQDKLLTGRKTDMVSVILAGTEETNNSLSPAEEGYENLVTLQGIAMGDNKLVRTVLNTTSAKGHFTDILSALILAVNDMCVHCRTLKYSKRIVLFTDAESETDWADIDIVREKVESNGIQLIIVIAGYGRDEGAVQSQFRSTKQNDNIKHLVKLSDSENVDIIDLKDALDQLSTFKVKSVNPVPVFRGDIILGDKEAHPDEALSIPVLMYARTYEYKLPTAKKWSALSEMQDNKNQWPTHDVGKEVSFRVKGSKSSSEVNGQSSVTQADNDDDGESSAPLLSDQDLERAYPFGKSLVVVTQEDERFMKMSTRAGMFIIGFLNATKVPRDYFMSNVYVILSRPHENEAAACSISALSRALYEKNAYALVRYVAKEDQQPKLGILMPYFEPHVDALHFVRVPFAEDLRQFPFAPLDVVVLPNGKELTEHKNLPTKELEDAMDDFVSRMELPLDSSGRNSCFTPEKIYNPVVWRLNEAIKQRSLNKAAPIPKLHPILQAQLEPEPSMIEGARNEIQKLKEVASVTKVDQKERKKRGYGKGKAPEENIAPVEDIVGNKEEALKRYRVNPISNTQDEDTDVGSILKDTSNVRQVGTIDPIADFNAMINNKKEDLITEGIIIDTVLEEAEQYNDLCYKLKALCDPSNPQSQRLDFWKLMVKEKITLLTSEESSDVQNISKEDSQQFLSDAKTQSSQKSMHEDTDMAEPDDDFSADNLLDMLE
ncbi:hypothetical protein NQZ79_g7801 [Umbelopsis isabellina]|nr:hypothetical protein NQZ79_g7801 [Umbelopsis isabellina]